MTTRQFFLISPLAAVLISMAAIFLMDLSKYLSHLVGTNALSTTFLAVAYDVSREASELKSTLLSSTFL